MKARVVIIGAGPAGTVCAYLLKKAGEDCVVMDQATFPREKICGGGLTPKAYMLLERLMPELEYEYRAVKHGKIMMDGKVISEFESDKELRMVRRKDFDYQLLKAYQTIGGELWNGAFESMEIDEKDQITVRLKSGDTLTCDYLIGADGANSRVRKALLGCYEGNTLWMEQYQETGEDAFVFDLSRDYGRGYFFSFPSVGRDVVGAGGNRFAVKDFKPLLDKNGIGETKAHGAYISVETVASGHERIMLIGDAGGFANRISYEGLYYAIATAQNAYRAVVENKPFSETNKEIFKKKRKEDRLARVFFSRFGLWTVKVGAKMPGLIKWVFERYV